MSHVGQPVRPVERPTTKEFLVNGLDEVTRKELRDVPRVAVRLIEACDAAELLAGRGRRSGVVATSDDIAQAAVELRGRLFRDDVQVVLTDEPLHSRELTGSGWPEYRSRLQEELGLRSFATLPLRTGTDHRASLLLYSRGEEALDGATAAELLLVASVAGNLVRELALREQVRDLGAALDSNRHIGVALGIIVERLHISERDAFLLLQRASQAQNRKLRDIADDVVLTGQIG